MKNMVLLMAGVLLLAGCATKEMKSTPFYEGGEVAYVGEAADRVNLWPVAYWRNPVGAVAWPLVSFSDDHFALRPIYSQYKQTGKDGAWDEFNFLWPIVQADTMHDDYRVFPIFWGEDYQAVFPIYWNGPHYNSLFPIWYYGSSTNSWHFNTLAGLAGACRKESGYRASWTFPLWYEDNTGLFTTLLYGQTRDSHWVFPLWYKGEKAFISPLYAQGEDGDKSWWVITPLVGVTSGRQTGGWVFPVWSHDKDADFAEKLALIDSPTLPDCVKMSVVTNTYKKGSEYGKTRCMARCSAVMIVRLSCCTMSYTAFKEAIIARSLGLRRIDMKSANIPNEAIICFSTIGPSGV